MRGECDDVVALTEGVSLLIPRRRMARIMCSRSGSGWGVEVCLSCCGVPSGGWSCWNQLEITAPPPSGCACRGHREAGGVGAEWGARRRGTCAPLCFVQRATDLSACLSLASRFPPLGLKEPPPLLCAPTLCFPSPPESKGGGRAIGLLFPPVQLSGRGETEVLMDVSSWRLALVQHRHLPARGLLSLFSLLRAFLLTVIKRNQAKHVATVFFG
jgi:hypothetical protein